MYAWRIYNDVNSTHFYTLCLQFFFFFSIMIYFRSHEHKSQLYDGEKGRNKKYKYHFFFYLYSNKSAKQNFTAFQNSTERTFVFRINLNVCFLLTS